MALGLFLNFKARINAFLLKYRDLFANLLRFECGSKQIDQDPLMHDSFVCSGNVGLRVHQLH